MTAAVAVVIPTFRRAGPLARALASALAQRPPEGATVEVVVVDNSPEGGARAQVEAMTDGAPFPLRYVHEPDPGVANARNRGVAEARSGWIAFLDDDEEAAPDWLAAFLAAAEATGADAVFGPVSVAPEEGAALGPFAGYFGRAFDLPDHADLTGRAAHLGTNNSMFRRERCLLGEAGAPPFDPSLNRSGGEDSLLLQRLALTGRRFAWAAQAHVAEYVPPRRLTWSYVWRRRFLSGQIRTFVQRMLAPPRWSRVALWMAVGAGQAAVGALKAAALAPFDRDAARHATAEVWAGLGKILWMRRFRPGLYGTGLVS